MNPYASFWLKVFGDASPELPDGSVCTSLPNATGSAAQMSVQYTDVHQDLVLSVSPVPTTPGLFFYATMVFGSPPSLGDGLRCVGGPTRRMFPFVSAGMMMQLASTATLEVDYGAPYATGLVGTRHFQYWFRSGLASGTGSNSSDADTITF